MSRHQDRDEAITDATRRAALAALDAWDPDNADDETIRDLFRAIFGRRPAADDGDLVSHIYAARDVLTTDEARRVLDTIGD